MAVTTVDLATSTARRIPEDKEVVDDKRKSPWFTRQFRADLESVFATDASDDIPPWELKALAKELDRWSKSCHRALKKKLLRLPDDHPAKCPISLYGCMDMGRLEVAHTRTLAWLLNPANREHGFGTTLLYAFLRRLCRFNTPTALAGCRVEAERICRNSVAVDAGRTDLWIEPKPGNSKPWLVVVEAKINASEGDHQLRRYNAEIEKWRNGHRGGDVHRVFLTPDGRDPTSGKGWKPASFKRLAQVFCDAACDDTERAGYQFLRYYLTGVLKDIIGLPVGQSGGQRDPHGLLEFLTKRAAI